MEGKKRGQPKKEPTTTINFRIKKVKKKILVELFGGQINRMFDIWSDKLIKEENEKSSSNDSLNESNGIGTK